MVVKYFKCRARFYISISCWNVKSIRLMEGMELAQVQVIFQRSELAHKVDFFFSVFKPVSLRLKKRGPDGLPELSS